MNSNLYTSDQVWKRLSETDPYWGVLSMDQFHGEITGDVRELFFSTGRNGVEHMMFKAKLAGWKGDNKVAVDFGCGVGRLSHSLAKNFDKVYSIDISEKMLELCIENCKSFGNSNVIPVISDDTMSGLDGVDADFILSVITFQHIRPERGIKIIDALLSKLKIGGAAAFFVLIGGTGHTITEEVSAEQLESGAERLIEMNVYNIHELMKLFQTYASDVNFTFVPTGGQMGANIWVVRDK